MATRRPLPRRKRKQSSADLTHELMQLINHEHFSDVITRCDQERKRVDLSATCLHLLGIAQSRLGQFDLAIQTLKRAVEQCGTNPGAGPSLAIENELSKAYFSAERFAEAGELLLSLVQRHPEQIEFHRNLVLVLENAGRLNDAIERCVASISLWPNDAGLEFQLGDLYMAVRSYRRAADSFTRCLELDSQNQSARRRLVSAYRALGDQDMVVGTLRQWHDHEPDNAIVAHLLAAHQSQSQPTTAQPTRASDAYVRELFDEFAEKFEDQLTALQYASPRIIAEMLADLGLEKSKDRCILDAGCGTGLMSQHLLPYASRLVGVDLSDGMLQRAAGRGYDKLVCGDLVRYLAEQPESFDLIVSADTLNYFGDLEPVFAAARLCLRDNDSSLIFTLEKHDDDLDPIDTEIGYRLNLSGRYSHDAEYVRRTLQQAGFSDIHVENGLLRREADKEVVGQYWIGKKSLPL
ncbi:MAG: tetratricopeptide repeat protein [Planctomycetales bacterium]|nr:tetratricopeptide repeat protein [Planctomycetales bacterium]